MRREGFERRKEGVEGGGEGGGKEKKRQRERKKMTNKNFFLTFRFGLEVLGEL